MRFHMNHNLIASFFIVMASTYESQTFQTDLFKCLELIFPAVNVIGYFPN